MLFLSLYGGIKAAIVDPQHPRTRTKTQALTDGGGQAISLPDQAFLEIANTGHAFITDMILAARNIPARRQSI